MINDQTGSKDGTTCADHNQPYEFGTKLTSAYHVPFTELQFGKLLVLRGRIQNGEFADDVRPD